MRWRSLGRLWAPEGSLPWAQSHAMLPTPLLLPDGRLRLFLACCDAAMVGRIGWIDLDGKDPRRVVGEARAPVLEIGAPGCFDDNGVNPTSLVVLPGGGLRLYYTGYQLQTKVPYTLFTGAAEASDADGPFTRVQEVPVMDRGPGERLFRTAALVQRGEPGWSIIYIGGGEFAAADGRQQPRYGLMRATSPDGLRWPPIGEVLMQPGPGEIGFGRPWLHREEDGSWTLWYSIRTPRGYRIGHATSPDGRDWTRRDDAEGLDGEPGGWDGEMRCYAVVARSGGETWMFYNGNGYGRSGVGIAILERE